MFYDAARASYTQALDYAAAGVPPQLEPEAVVVEGDVVERLAELGPDEVDMLVCGSRGYGPIRRVLGGAWNALNFTRQLVFNLIFLVIVLLVLVAIFASPGVQPIYDKTALVIDLDGSLELAWTRMQRAGVRRILSSDIGVRAGRL